MILRSLLFVPADSEKKRTKAKSSPADALILDLEDSVAAANRPAAREAVCGFLGEKHPQSIWVRVNAFGSEDFAADIEAVVPARPAGLIVPKLEAPDMLDPIGETPSAGRPQSGVCPMAGSNSFRWRPKRRGRCSTCTALRN